MPQQTTQSPPETPAAGPASVKLARQKAANFVEVVKRVEPVAERECRQRLRGGKCDFQIYEDDRPGVGANAYQTVDRGGRPVIVFTIGLIAMAQNKDELAFVMGHEAAHHIAGHLDKKIESARAGAVVLAGLAVLTGGDAEAVRTAQQLGAEVGSRSYSKKFELEAGALGTVIAKRAGYNPLRGAQFFNRIPDPGDKFLGTHPPNAQRLATVRRVAAGL